jgi:hypothetical protein
VNILKENDLNVDVNSPLYNEFAIDDIATIFPSSNNFADLDSPPYTVVPIDCPSCTFSPADCCGDSSPSLITIDACEISSNKDLSAEIDCQGRLLTIRVILKCVCPNKKVAIGVLILEGTKVRGFKGTEIITPPRPTGCPSPTDCPGKQCENVVVCKFCFVIPGSICCPITLTPKVIAHYTDFNIDPCSTVCPTGLHENCCP